ncbi:hypothetical protein THAOC_34474, partial [Thalassiosira oceanica]
MAIFKFRFLIAVAAAASSARDTAVHARADGSVAVQYATSSGVGDGHERISPASLPRREGTTLRNSWFPLYTTSPTVVATDGPTTGQTSSPTVSVGAGTLAPSGKPTAGATTSAPSGRPSSRPTTATPSKMPMTGPPTNKPTGKPATGADARDHAIPDEQSNDQTAFLRAHCEPIVQTDDDPFFRTNNPVTNREGKREVSNEEAHSVPIHTFCLDLIHIQPTLNPSKQPSSKPTTMSPTLRPSPKPTLKPTAKPTNPPSVMPTQHPVTDSPSALPTRLPSPGPTSPPTKLPSRRPSFPPTNVPTRNPTREPTPPPSSAPSRQPTLEPSTAEPSRHPASDVSCARRSLGTTTFVYSPNVSLAQPTPGPTTAAPTHSPSKHPATDGPTVPPTADLSNSPSYFPTTTVPTYSPIATTAPSQSPVRSYATVKSSLAFKLPLAELMDGFDVETFEGVVADFLADRLDTRKNITFDEYEAAVVSQTLAKSTQNGTMPAPRRLRSLQEGDGEIFLT